MHKSFTHYMNKQKIWRKLAVPFSHSPKCMHTMTESITADEKKCDILQPIYDLSFKPYSMWTKKKRQFAHYAYSQN